MNDPLHLPGLPADAARRYARMREVASWLDTRFVIPGTQVRIGLDPILGLIPGIGDFASLIASSWLVREAHYLEVSFEVKARMMLNVIIDALIGSLPFLGDLFDAAFRANQRNVALVASHLRKKHGL